MPQSITSISNMALGHCGVNSRIGDVETENSNEANACRLYFDHCRELLLEMQEWGFAKEEVALQSLGSPPDPWGFRYKYPNFCSLALYIVNPSLRTPGRDQRIPFEVRNYDGGTGKVILCDQENAILAYNRNIDNVALFAPSFVQALSLVLAAHICMPLRVDPKITQYINAQAGPWLNEAASRSLREQQKDPEPDSEFVRARG